MVGQAQVLPGSRGGSTFMIRGLCLPCYDPSLPPLSAHALSSTPLGWRGWRVQPRCRWWEFPLAEGTCAGPTGEQYLQLAHDRKRGQADARAFGSSRSSVTKAWATDTKLT